MGSGTVGCVVPYHSTTRAWTPRKNHGPRGVPWGGKHGIRKDTCAPTTIAPQKRSITNYRSHAINGVSSCCRRLPLRRRVWNLSRRSSIKWNRRSRTICELGSTFTLSTSIPARPLKDEDRQNRSHVCMGGRRFDLGQYGGV